jgi:hypothetical protein
MMDADPGDSPDVDVRQIYIDQCTAAVTTIIDKSMWRMIARGQLFSLGWRLAVRTSLEDIRAAIPDAGAFIVKAWPIGPDEPNPVGTTVYTLAARA